MARFTCQTGLLMVTIFASTSLPVSAQLREVYVPKRCIDNKPGDIHVQCISSRPIGSTNTNLPTTGLLSSFAAAMAHAATSVPDTVTDVTLQQYNQFTSTLHDAGLTGPWTDKDTEELFDVIGEAPKIGNAISFVRSTGELDAQLTFVKGAPGLSFDNRRYVEAYLTAKYACMRLGGVGLDDLGIKMPGGEQGTCDRLKSAFPVGTVAYADYVGEQVGIVPAFKRATGGEEHQAH